MLLSVLLQNASVAPTVRGNNLDLPSDTVKETHHSNTCGDTSQIPVSRADFLTEINSTYRLMSQDKVMK